MNPARPAGADVANTSAVVKRPKDRAERIRVAAARLFRRRGYHMTGIDEIGEAVGITGPAVYRHYKNKAAVLAAIVSEAGERTHRVFVEAASSSGDPAVRLEAVVRAAIRVTLEHTDDAAVYLRDWRHLEPSTRHAVREVERRNNRILVDAVADMRPELAEPQIRLMVQSVVGLILSLRHYRSPVPRARLVELLTGMAMEALRTTTPVVPGELHELDREAFARLQERPPMERASRREVVLAAAAKLFRERGFSGVSIDEIGPAAGIAGPGLYRHFRNKEELLLACFVRTQEQLSAGASRAVGLTTPNQSLEALTESYIDVAIKDDDMMAVRITEGHELGPELRRSVERRQRWYVGEWSLVLQRVRPDLPKGEVRVAVYAVLGLVDGHVMGVTRLPAEHARATLAAMVAAAIASIDPSAP